MRKKIKNLPNQFLRKLGFEIRRSGASTRRLNLELFSEFGTDRDWHQVAMYCSVMNEIANIPGDIAEFGVAGGTSFSAFARLIKIFDPYRDHKVAKRMLYGFDTFEGLPFFDTAKDAGQNVPSDMQEGGFNASRDYPSLLERVKEYDNVILYKGVFDQSLPRFWEENKHASFALIHIDCDLHQSTIDALKSTILRLNIGGVILFDEIFHREYPGETSGFFEVYNNLEENFCLEFKRVRGMPWKWYAVRTA